MRWTIAALAFAALLSGPEGARAQTFLGKNAAAWVAQLQSADAGARRDAAFALGKLGPSVAALAAAPLKASLRGDKTPMVREAAAMALGEIGKNGSLVADPEVVTLLSATLTGDADPLVRRSAAVALGNLGPAAAAAVATLEAALDEGKNRPEVRQNVAWALGRLGGTSSTGLRRGLRDADPLVKRDAAGSLAQLPPKTIREALPELLACLPLNDSEVRRAALLPLVKVLTPGDKSAARALAAITDRKNEPDEEVRRNAALALANIGGPESAAAVPVLVEAFQKGNLELRRQAAAGLRNIGPEAAAAVPALAAGLSDADDEIRANSAMALGGIGLKAVSAIPALAALTANAKEKTNVRFEAATALKNIGAEKEAKPPAEKIVPLLLDVLGDPSQETKIRERALWALRVHHGNLRNLGVYPTLTKVLGEKGQRMLRYDCAYTLGMLQGPAVPDAALDSLNDFLHDDSILIYVGKTATVGGANTETGTGKANVSESGKGDGRVMAVQALNQIGAERVRNRPEIVQQLRSLADNAATYQPLRDSSRELLTKIGN